MSSVEFGFVPFGLEKSNLSKRFEFQIKNSELAQELRGLQFSNAPVANRESKNRLEQFFSNAISQQNTNAPVSTSNPILYRSSAVANEIAELNSRQRVSNVLTTSTREEIERTLISSRRPNPIAPQHPVGPINPIPEPPSLNLPNASNILSNQREAWLTSNTRTNPVEEYTREQIIGEISELVHSHVVSNALQSEFRTNLENRILDRLRRSGTDGDRPRQIIRELARRNNNLITRNDFSHLGIEIGNRNAADLDNIDSASSINEQRANRSAIRNTKEIKELKNEVSELKNLLKLSFELQLDMQRSLKQEINALISNTFQNSASASLLNISRPSNEGSCLICTESKVDTVFYTCGHMCVSYTKKEYFENQKIKFNEFLFFFILYKRLAIFAQ